MFGKHFFFSHSTEIISVCFVSCINWAWSMSIPFWNFGLTVERHVEHAQYKPFRNHTAGLSIWYMVLTEVIATYKIVYNFIHIFELDNVKSFMICLTVELIHNKLIESFVTTFTVLSFRMWMYLQVFRGFYLKSTIILLTYLQYNKIYILWTFKFCHMVGTNFPIASAVFQLFLSNRERISTLFIKEIVFDKVV